MSPTYAPKTTRAGVSSPHVSLTCLDLLDEGGDLLVELALLSHLIGDLVNGADHRGVIPTTEDLADRWIGVVGE